MATPNKVPNDRRRKWDLAKSVEVVHGKGSNAMVNRQSLLNQRDSKINLDDRVGKKSIVAKRALGLPSQAGGFCCTVCDCTLQDSMNFYDHVNGRKHHSNLGMSMKNKRSTLDQVKRRLEFNKKKHHDERKIRGLDQERAQELQEEEYRSNQYSSLNRKRKAAETPTPIAAEELDTEIPVTIW